MPNWLVSPLSVATSPYAMVSFISSTLVFLSIVPPCPRTLARKSYPPPPLKKIDVRSLGYLCFNMISLTSNFPAFCSFTTSFFLQYGVGYAPYPCSDVFVGFDDFFPYTPVLTYSPAYSRPWPLFFLLRQRFKADPKGKAVSFLSSFLESTAPFHPLFAHQSRF